MNTKGVVAITAIVACVLTNTVRDILYVRNNGEFNSKVSKIARILKDYSLYEADEDKMGDFAAAGMLLAVDDHYTNYYSKDDYESYKTNLSNSFMGVGIVLSIDPETEKLVVVSPIDGSGAAKAGILAGDFVLAVDGIYYLGDEMDAAVAAIRGADLEEKAGTKVVLTIERDGKEMDIEVERGIVENDSVSEKMLDDSIGYVRITAFNSADVEDETAKDTYDEFSESLNILKEQGMKSLVLDLRGNPGGSLDVVIKIADELLPYGIITYTEDKNGKR
ncbi:MAG: PDZ domain-containing protein, partial [Clostridia bacterium]|nr:PDZ domain-containing protein [Clostridia bacterium]